MKPLPQHYLSLMISVYIGVILNLPTFYQNIGNTTSDFMQMAISAIGITAFTCFLLLFLSLAGKTVYRLLASLILLFSSAASYYMIFFDVVIGYGVIVAVLTTDIDLSREQVGYQFMAWLLFTGVLPMMALWHAPFSGDKHPETGTRQPLKTFLKTVIACLFSAVIATHMFRLVDEIGREKAAKNNSYAPSPSGMLAHAYLPANWISALALYAWEKGYGEKSIAHLFNPAEHFSYHAVEQLEDTYIVVVIGETTRADHMGMLGYHRNTTPQLASETNLMAFRGVSCDTSTKLSLRCMFVRENGASDNEQRTLKEYNIFAVLKKLGFSSELFAMQSEMWFYNSTKTDTYKFREILSAEQANTGKPIDDMILINELQQSIINHPEGKHLVVLHTKGSHFQYSERYPREYAQFTPECHSIDDNCTTAEMINSFDNTVLYTDTVLKNAIDSLRHKKALLIYAADHGESITEDDRFHGTPRHLAPAEEFRVPIIIWASDSFINSSSQRRETFARLQEMENEQHIVSHTVLFDSILGCLGYVSHDGGINDRNNLCSAFYAPATITHPIGGAYPSIEKVRYISEKPSYHDLHNPKALTMSQTY